MRLFLTGGTGLIGRRLIRARPTDRLILLTRDAVRAEAVLRDAGAPELEVVEGDPARGGAWQEKVDGCDAVVSLAGAGIADRRWSAAYKKVLAESRIEAARRVVEAIGRARKPPAVLVNASAVGYYGDRGDRPLDESAPAGGDFLGRMCQEWESAAQQAAACGARVMLLRFGVVLDPTGGALKKMLTPFRMGLGGPVSTGRQFMPWIHWRDAVGLVDLALGNRDLCGPLNAVAPEAVTSRQFASALGRVLRRPAYVPVPKLALRLIMGEVADALVMSQRVVPAVAQRAGFRFQHPEVSGALVDLLRRT